jgi:predicted nucleic acid-binding protein
MEIILNALLGALANVGETAVKDAYFAVKALISKKYGKKSKLAEAIEQLEKNPDSAARRAELAEQLKAAKADQDHSVIKAAHVLMGKIQELPRVQQNIEQTVEGNRTIFSASGNVSVKFDGKDT